MTTSNLLIWILALGICLFQFADYWTTAKILQRGGNELNPVMRLLFKGFGMRTGLIITKMYVAVIAVIGAWLGWWVGTGFIVLAVLFVIYATVVSHNIYQYRKG